MERTNDLSPTATAAVRQKLVDSIGGIVTAARVLRNTLPLIEIEPSEEPSYSNALAQANRLLGASAALHNELTDLRDRAQDDVLTTAGF